MENDSTMLMKGPETYQQREVRQEEMVSSSQESRAVRQETWVLGLTTTNLLCDSTPSTASVSLFVN